MKVSEYLDMMARGEKLPKPRKHSTNEEHRLQCAEMRYIRAIHPELERVCFAVPNGQKRTSLQTSWLHDEGMVNGVADIILLKPNKFYPYLCIENKTPIGKQSKEQKLFQEAVESQGGKYVIARSLDEFVKIIEDYLKDKAS